MVFGPFTPGIIDSESDRERQKMMMSGTGRNVMSSLEGGLNKLIGNPFLMNLLAQQGYSTMPSSPLGAIGRASIMTQQQQREGALDSLRAQLIQSRLKADSSPSNVRSFEFFEALGDGSTPDRTREAGDDGSVGLSPAQKRFLLTVRSPTVKDIPGVGFANLTEGAPNVIAPESVVSDALAGRAGAKEGAVQGAQTQAIPDKSRETGVASRHQTNITKGIDASDRIAIPRRALELLDSVETGGIDAALLRAKQAFGVEGADEAELSSNLGKAVVSQLRETFGAQFTVREGEELKRIEAGFGKSTEGNKRLLQQAVKLLERAAERGIKSAEAIGDFEAADQIRSSLGFTLSTGTADKPISELTDEELEAIVNGSNP